MAPYPEWLHILSWVSLVIAFICAGIVTLDLIRRPQKMAIMNLVWPISQLYFGPLGLWAYFRAGVKSSQQHHEQMLQMHGKQQMEQQKKELKSEPPTITQVSLGTTHCGAGCSLGDIFGEWWVAAAGLTFAGGVLETRLVVDFILAWGFGVVFQYFTIVPMRGLSVGNGIWAAIKADTVSIVAYQIGMSIWMALTYYVIFPAPHLKATEAVFWFMMQIAMVIGFFTSYPANRWLMKSGLKEKMPQMPSAAYALDRVA